MPESRLMYDKIKTATEAYSYQVNSGGSLNVKENGEIKIVFQNGKFFSATFPFSGSYSRNGWRILAAINKEIENIENAEATA